jgi:hypothetical protein
MRSHQDCLDFFPLHCANFGWLNVPPCNEPTTIALIGLGVSAATGAAGAYISYDASKTAAKQAELNAEAQNKAIGQEQIRQAQQNEENQRRAVTEQARFRAQQTAAMAASGATIGTGTSLALEADTWAKQQTELSDQQHMADLSQRQLSYEGQSLLAMGQQQSSAIKAQGTAKLISDIGNIAGQAYQGYSTRPQKTGGSTVPSGYTPKPVSARPSGL